LAACRREKRVKQPVSRRTVLTLAGSGLAGAASPLAGSDPASAAESAARIATERAYRPLAASRSQSARIAQTDPGFESGVRVDASLERRAIRENDELVVIVRIEVPNNLIGRRRVLRTMMLGDNGDLRMETVGSEVRIDDPQFELEIVLDRSHPIRDWNLIRERIYAVRVSLNVLDTDAFAVSDDFLFKVLRA
jgi:hypothetical protein